MLEGKQIELSKHLKELSLKNDQVSYFYWLYSSLASQSQIITVCKWILQAINEIRKKYELEKIEITNAEKEKVHELLFQILLFLDV